MSYVDVETTAEALQEDEELIEAVENLVETAAVSVKAEIMMEVQNAREVVIDWLEWMFPLWVLYRNDHAQFWADLQKVALSGVLLAISFVLLAPVNTNSRRAQYLNRRRRRSLLGMTTDRHSFRLFQAPNYLRRHSSMDSSIDGGDGFVQIKSQTSFPGSNNSNNNSRSRRPSTSLLTGRVICQEEIETDSERFEKNYGSLLMNKYRRLLLPPDCKLVEKPKRQKPPASATKSSKNKKTKKRRRKKRERDNMEENPAKRLQLYAQNLFYLIRSLLSYDYVGAGMALIRWLEAFLRIRHLRRNHLSTEEEEDDDDDDESKASASVASASVSTSTTVNRPQQVVLAHQNSNSSANYSTNNFPITPERQEHPSIYLDGSFTSSALDDGEEKKESPLMIGSSSCSSGGGGGGGGAQPQSPPQMSLGDQGEPSTPLTGYNAMKRRTSESSLYGTPAGSCEVVPGDGDDMTALRLPLQANMSSSSNHNKSATSALRPSIGGGKKKDLLENYRSSKLVPSNKCNPQSHPASTSQSTTSTSMSSSSSHAHSSSCGDITTIHRNHIDEIDMNDENDSVNPAGDTINVVPDSREEEEDSFEDSSEPDDPPGRTQRFDSSDFSAYFFETANTRESLDRMSIEAPLPDKHGYILGDEFLSDSNSTPLLVFVNSRSGPQQGQLLITQLRRLLNPIQVWDLGEDGGPETVLESFCVFRNLRILVCGGDGTVSWIIAALEKLKLKRKWPPIGILPLGTGNDLARIHGWGGGYNNESLIGILEQVADSYISLLDRWELTVENRKGKVKEQKQFFNYLGVGADAQTTLQVHMLRESKPNLFFSRVVNKFWYGLFGAEDIIKTTSLNLPNEITLIADGVEVPLPPDSQGIILLNIDSYSGGAPFWSTGLKPRSGLHGFQHSNSAGRSPELRSNRYNHYSPGPGHLRRTRSLEDLGLRSSTGSLDRVDSVEDLSQLLDADQLYERVTACDMPSSCQDGFLDIVSIRGNFHLGQIRVGLSNAQRLCQCREVTIHIKRKVAVQIDGEPWRQNTCTLKVKRKGDRVSMLHKSEDKNGIETEVGSLLDWAEKRELINGDVHYAMMKEFSRRIEHKTRQRRTRRDQDNIMYSLKRAIGSTGALSSSYASTYAPNYNGSYEYHS